MLVPGTAQCGGPFSVEEEDDKACLTNSVVWGKYLLIGLEHIASEGTVWYLSRNVAEYIEILRVVAHIEYPIYWMTHDKELLFTVLTSLLQPQNTHCVYPEVNLHSGEQTIYSAWLKRELVMTS